MNKSLAVTFAATLIVAGVQGAQVVSWDPLFEVDGAFRDAVVHDDCLFLLAGKVAVGQPDVPIWQLGADGVGRQVGGYRARYAPLALYPAAGWMYLTEGDELSLS